MSTATLPAKLTRDEWSDLRTSVDSRFRENGEMLERFRSSMAVVFSGMAEGKTAFPRKPPISLRLVADGGPAAKLIVMPGWNTYHKTIDAERVYCELLTETLVETKEGPGKDWKQTILFSISVDGARSGCIRRTALEDVERPLKVICDFLTDHRAVFARSHDFCVICGRGLTDETSRARGIGPECIVSKAPYLRFLSDRSIVVVEPIAPTANVNNIHIGAAEPEPDDVFRLVAGRSTR